MKTINRKGGFIMKRTFNRILSVILTAATMISSLAVPASATTTVSAPVASIKSGTHYASYCEHSEKNPGYHYYYDDGKIVKSFRECVGYYESLPISLSCSTKGATIYFETEVTSSDSSWTGNARFEKGLTYSKPIEITEDTKITAYAVKNGVKSETVTYTYKICSKIRLSHEGGTYDDPISIQVTNQDGTPLSGYIYYTTDGSKPTLNSKQPVTRSLTFFEYSYIDISESCTLRMLVVPPKGSGKTSYYLTEKYVIKGSDSSTSSSKKPYEDKYYYNTLTDGQKENYAALYDAATFGVNGTLKSSVGKGGESKVRDAFFNENPEFPIDMLGWQGTTVFTNNSTAQQKKIKTATKDLIAEAKKLSSDYDKVKYFHDEIIKMTKYSASSSGNQNAYGVFVNKKAACRGYANAFAYLCQAVGIECIIVDGYVAAGDHAWNMVKVDGNWYHTDLTWDDPTNLNTVKYTYFLLSDAQMGKDHTVDTHLDIPSAPKSYSKSNTNSNTSTTDKEDKDTTSSSSKDKTNSSNSSVIDTRLLEPNVFDLAVGSRVKLSYLFDKVDGVSFSSSDKSVVKIVKTSSGTRYVKGVGEGEAIITAKYKGETAKINVYVVDINDENSKFSLSAKKSVYVGKTIKITAKIDTTTDEYITWVIPNKKYFEVVASSGDNSRYITLKALKKGTTKIYAITSTGDVKTISITIK